METYIGGKQMIPAQELTFEDICNLGRAESESLDEKRFKLGDLGNLIQSKYGQHSIDEFAKEIGQGRSTCYQYSKVASFYPPEVRAIIKENYPNIGYSVMRDSMRCGDIMAATEWLEECSTNSYTVDEAARKLTEKLGHQTRDPIEGYISRKFTQEDGWYIIVKFDSDVDIQTGQQVTIKAK